MPQKDHIVETRFIASNFDRCDELICDVEIIPSFSGWQLHKCKDILASVFASIKIIMNNDAPPPQNSNPKYKGKYRIDSTRLPAWNYASDGGYFVTICTDRKKYFFGEVVQGEMQLSAIGEIAYKLWYEIPKNFSNCQIDSFCVMPNHIHGIVIINQTQQGNAMNGTQEEDAMNRVLYLWVFCASSTIDGYNDVSPQSENIQNPPLALI
ncbi:MAG: transposase [Nostoc sp. ChiSLP02]|nr:transposase [Nostoc sp. DedSLP05]MDZ8098651.1 transposase [Nostoc sp. DedSLP01]MDZ8183737.1 transposase [Nostoc sp. ChiSLP02]